MKMHGRGGNPVMQKTYLKLFRANRKLYDAKEYVWMVGWAT